MNIKTILTTPLFFINYDAKADFKMKNYIRYIILLTLFIASSSAIHGQNKPIYPSLFASDEVLKVSIYFDISTHIRKKSEDYCKGQITIYHTETDSTTLNTRCKARGHHRKDNCLFPPVMLNFKPDTLFTSDGPITKLKLVTHCQNTKAYSKYLLKEYLIYKLWEIISPYSFRTRLLDIQYFDKGDRDKDYRAFGFFLEPVYMLTNRTETIEIKGGKFKDEQINALDADRVAIFNYMIGNTDWRILTGHNVKFLKRFGFRREEATPIPYDFDHAGFVNAAYAKPAEWSSAKQVTERDYVGKCRNDDDNYLTLIEEFNEAQDEIYRTIMEFEHLDIKTRKKLHRYVEEFFRQLEKPDAFIRTLHNSCMDRY